MNMKINLQFLKGQRVENAIIVEWYKKEGDYVKKDEPLVQIETFKITTDILAPCGGILKEILYKEFEYCCIDDDIANIDCIDK